MWVKYVDPDDENCVCTVYFRDISCSNAKTPDPRTSVFTGTDTLGEIITIFKTDDADVCLEILIDIEDAIQTGRTLVKFPGANKYEG
jgi:hypothetical protein